MASKKNALTMGQSASCVAANYGKHSNGESRQAQARLLWLEDCNG